MNRALASSAKTNAHDKVLTHRRMIIGTFRHFDILTFRHFDISTFRHFDSCNTAPKLLTRA